MSKFAKFLNKKAGVKASVETALEAAAAQEKDSAQELLEQLKNQEPETVDAWGVDGDDDDPLAPAPIRARPNKKWGATGAHAGTQKSTEDAAAAKPTDEKTESAVAAAAPVSKYKDEVPQLEPVRLRKYKARRDQMNIDVTDTQHFPDLGGGPTPSSASEIGSSQGTLKKAAPVSSSSSTSNAREMRGVAESETKKSSSKKKLDIDGKTSGNTSETDGSTEAVNATAATAEENSEPADGHVIFALERFLKDLPDAARFRNVTWDIDATTAKYENRRRRAAAVV